MACNLSMTLLIGDQPAPPEVLDVMQQLEIEDHADMADILRLSLSVGVGQNGSRWNVVDRDIFQRFTNLKVLVTVQYSQPQVLMDAVVTETNLQFSNQPGGSTFSVVAMDRTALLNLKEQARPWPDMADSDIAATIFGEYELDTEIESTEPSRQEDDVTVMQRGTDMQFLRQLARRNGYEVYVENDSETGKPVGHFHPVRLDVEPQGTLAINLGEATNVNSFNARYEMLRPTEAHARNVAVDSVSDQDTEVTSQTEEQLGNVAMVGGERPRRSLVSHTGLADTGEMQTNAQGVVDRSAWAITADGELNTAAYGGVLRAKRPVLVRGAGPQFSGSYYVQRVHHTFTGQSYTQAFTLRRNALEATGRESFAGDEGLAPRRELGA